MNAAIRICRMVRRVLLVLPAVTALVAQEAASRAVVEGRVVDVLGRSVPAAELCVVRSGKTLARTLSDGEGVFSLRGPVVAGADLVIAARGKATQRLRWQPGPEKATAAIVLPDAARLRGQVRDAIGRPVAGAEVVVVGRQTTVAVTADGVGRYEVAGAPLCEIAVRAWGSDSFGERRLLLTADAELDLELPALGGAGPRRVRVRGVPPEMLRAACVEITSPDLALRAVDWLPFGADGSLEFLPSDTSLVRVRIPGYSTAPAGFLVDPRGSGELVFFARELGGGADRLTCRGRIVDPGSAPIVGTRVRVEDRFQGVVGRGVVDEHGSFAVATPLPEGAFCRLGIEFGDWQFANEEAENARGASWLVYEAPPRGRQLLPVYHAVPTTQLSGSCATADQQKLAFAEINVLACARPSAPAVQLWADRDGRFAVHGLPAAEYQIVAIGERGEILTAEVLLPLGEHLAVPRWTRVPDGALAGVCVDATGRGCPGVRLHLRAPEVVAGLGQLPLGRRELQVTTDRDGRFRCLGLHAGDWLVALPERPAVATEVVEITPGKTASLRIALP